MFYAKKRFAGLLSRLEKKPACKGRSLEIFLTYPMHQVDDDVMVMLMMMMVMLMMIYL